MATFAKHTFNAAKYAAVRPSYPQELYKMILDYHRGPREQLLDLGCGHGIVARQFGQHFKHYLGTDPSPGMIEQARKLSPTSEYPGTTFTVAAAEDDVPLQDGGVDVVTAAQSCHWFDQPAVFSQLARKVRPGGTLAFWGYVDHVFVDYPRSNNVMEKYVYVDDRDKLGPYWPEGREILGDFLRSIKPPETEWEEVQRVEYDPAKRAETQATRLVGKRMKVGECKAYVRTWSSFHGWQETHEDSLARESGGKGDIVNEMFDEMATVDPIMGDDDEEVEVEWGSVVILARRRATAAP